MKERVVAAIRAMNDINLESFSLEMARTLFRVKITSRASLWNRTYMGPSYKKKYLEIWEGVKVFLFKKVLLVA